MLLFTLLTGIIQKWSFEGFGNEVSIDTVLTDACARDNFLELVAGVTRFDERFFLFGLTLILAVGLWFDDRDVLRTFDSG